VDSLTLERAIEQMVNVGEYDPDEILRKLKRRHGVEWLRAEAADLHAHLVRAMARDKIGARRRAGERLSDAGGALSVEELHAGRHVPRRAATEPGTIVEGKGWVRTEDMTHEDHLSVAARYRKLSDAHKRRAERHEGYAALLAERGVETLAQLDASEWREAA
jgi:hypothetical protein